MTPAPPALSIDPTLSSPHTNANSATSDPNAAQSVPTPSNETESLSPVQTPTTAGSVSSKLRNMFKMGSVRGDKDKAKGNGNGKERVALPGLSGEEGKGASISPDGNGYEGQAQGQVHAQEGVSEFGAVSANGPSDGHGHTGKGKGQTEEQDVSGSTINVHLAPLSSHPPTPGAAADIGATSGNDHGPSVTATSPTPPLRNYASSHTSTYASDEQRARSSSIALSPTDRSSNSSSNYHSHSPHPARSANGTNSNTGVYASAGPSSSSLATGSGASTPLRERERGALGLGSFRSRFFPGPSPRSVSDYTGGTRSLGAAGVDTSPTKGMGRGGGGGGGGIKKSPSNASASSRKKSNASGSTGTGTGSGSGSDPYRGSGSGQSEQDGVNGDTSVARHGLPRTPSKKVSKKGGSAPGTVTTDRLGLPITATSSSGGSGSGSGGASGNGSTSTGFGVDNRDPSSNTRKSPEKGTLRNSAAARFLRRVVSAPNTKALFGRDEAAAMAASGEGGVPAVPPIPNTLPGSTSSASPNVNTYRTSPVKVQGMTPMTIDLADPTDSPSKSKTYNYPATAPLHHPPSAFTPIGQVGADQSLAVPIPDTPSTSSTSLSPTATPTTGGLSATGTRAARALTASASPARVREMQQTLGVGSPNGIPVPSVPGDEDAGGNGSGKERDGQKAAFRRTYSSHSIKTRQVSSVSRMVIAG